MFYLPFEGVQYRKSSNWIYWRQIHPKTRINHVFSTKYYHSQKVEEAAVDVDEEAETNDQVRAALTELTSPEWIFGKTPSFEVYTVEKSRMISVAKGKVTEAADESLIGKLLTIDVNI